MTARTGLRYVKIVLCLTLCIGFCKVHRLVRHDFNRRPQGKTTFPRFSVIFWCASKNKLSRFPIVSVLNTVFVCPFAIAVANALCCNVCGSGCIVELVFQSGLFESQIHNCFNGAFADGIFTRSLWSKTDLLNKYIDRCTSCNFAPRNFKH